MGFSLRFGITVLLTALLVEPGVSCTIVYPLVVVGPNFRVEVEDRGHPVQGLAIELRAGSVLKNRVFTDRNGVALFRGIPPGSFYLAADHAEGAAIEVRLAQTSEITVPVGWPNARWVLTGSPRGTLNLPDRIPGQPQRSLSLDLVEAVSGQKLKRTSTDKDGSFDFPGVARGLYFLRFSDGVIAVDVEPGVTKAPLDLDLGWTSCGLFYVNHSECPQTDLRVQRLEGRIQDAAGAPVPDAEIVLSDLKDELIGRARSDGRGSFGSLHPEDGIYHIVVQRSGFTTLRRTLIIDSSAASPLIDFQLGVMGLCSTARAE